MSISLRFSATASWVPAKSSSKPLTALPRFVTASSVAFANSPIAALFASMSVRFASRAGKILSWIPTANSLIFEVFLSMSVRFAAIAGNRLSWIPVASLETALLRVFVVSSSAIA